MSYWDIVNRVNYLCARVGIDMENSSVGQPDTTQFDEVLAYAQNRFDMGPQRVANPSGSMDPDYISGANAGFRSRTSPIAATRGLTPQLSASIERIADKHGVPAQLVKAVARAESGFRSDAVSPAGAQGMMQLMPATGRGLGVTDPFNAEQSIEGGTRYLKNALRMFGGDVRLALAAYNAGPNAVKRYDGIPPYAETRNYVDKVLGFAREFGLPASFEVPR
jgi:soluble lytic murein transglycosylase-like protein